MKGSTYLLGLVLLTGLSACARDGNQSRLWYDMLHEQQRQQCIEQGSRNCEPAQSYDRYRDQRNEAIKSE